MNWFSDARENPGVGGGDITRDKRKLAFQTGENDSTLTVYWVPEFPTAWRDSEPTSANPYICYRYSTPPGGGTFGIPTFSPDGSGLAFSEGDGIHVAAVPAFTDGCTLDGATETPPLVLPGATQPDWGPADVPPARTEPPKNNHQVPPKPSKKLSVKVLRASRRAGVKLRVQVTGKGRLSATAKARKKVVGKATKTIRKAGPTTLKLRVKRTGKVTVTVKFKPTSGTTLTRTVNIKVR
jgi:hypothetical protein